MHAPEHYDLWIRDYRPATLDLVVGNPQLIESFKRYLSNNNLPNLLLTGPHGTGKRVATLLLVKTYLAEHFAEGCIIIDGATYRGKAVVTNSSDYKKSSLGDSIDTEAPNIMSFTKKKTLLPPGKKKVVVIFNFDHMTPEPQNALRRIIETSMKNTRFILVCNDSSEIIEPIQSRCIPLQTTVLNETEIIEGLSQVLAHYHINPTVYAGEIYHTIALLSNGDLKKAINCMQVVAGLPRVDVDTIYQIFNLPPGHNIQTILTACQSDETYQVAYNTLNKLLDNGYAPQDILTSLITVIQESTTIPMGTKIALLRAIARCYINVETVPSSTLIYALIARFGKIYRDGYLMHTDL